MEMNCKIIYKRDPNTLKITDEVKAVKASNGKRSLLYDAIRNEVNSDKEALTNYYKIYTDEFKDVFGNWDEGMISDKLDVNNEPKFEESSEFIMTINSDVEVIQDDIELPVIDRQFSLNVSTDYVGQPSTKSSKTDSTSIDIEAFENNVNDDNYSKEQISILEKYNSNTSELTGNIVTVKIEELTPDLQRLFKLKGLDTAQVYETIDKVTGKKGIINYRVSNLQDLKKVQNQNQQTASQQEDSPKAQISRQRGTEMHDISENLLNAFVTSNNSIFSRDELLMNDVEDWSKEALVEFKKSDKYKELLKVGESIFLNETKTNKKTNSTYVTHKSSLMIDKLADSMLRLYYQVYETQQSINEISGKNNKPVFILEKPFMDKGNNIAGTMDIFVVFSDGTASIYDHKFTDLQAKKKYITKPSAEKLAEIKQIRELQGLPNDANAYNNWYYELPDNVDLYKKKDAWNSQIGKYSDMVRTLYGIKSIRQARILPVATTYTKVDLGNKKKDGKTKLEVGPGSQVEMILTGHGDLGLSQLALDIEKTGDENLDKFIGMLIKNKRSLNEEMQEKKAWDDPIYIDRIKTLDESIQGLLKSRDITNISTSIEKLAQQIENDLTNEKDQITFEQIINHLRDIEMFSSFIALSSNEIDRLEKVNSTKEGENPYTVFKNRLSVANYELKRQAEKMHNKMTVMIQDINSDKGFMSDATFNTFKQQKDMSTLNVAFEHLRESNHPIISLFSQLLDEINTNMMNDRRDLEKDLKKVHEDLKVWGKSKGLKGVDIYKDILGENKSLIRKYINYKKEVFPDHLDPVNHLANIEWFKNNFERVGVKEDLFQTKLKQVQDHYKRKFKDDEKEYDAQMNKWLDKNDVKYNNGDNQAWYNNYKQHWLTPKNPDEYYTEEYKNLIQDSNKPLLDFYNLYTTQMNKLATKADFRIYENSIPELRKDMIDTIVQDGMFLGGKQQLQNIKNWWTQNDNDDGMQLVMTEEGLERKVPIFFQNSVGEENKSLDLAKSLMIFSDFVNRYNGIKDIEHASLAMRELVAKTSGLQSKISGEIIRNEANDPLLKVGANANNAKLLDAFDTWIGYYIYGEKKKGSVKINKAVDAITAVSSKKGVALNYLSAAGGHINAEAQLQMISKKGTYFTPATLNRARKEVKLTPDNWRKSKDLSETLDSKIVFASLLFEPSQEDMSYEKANGISLSKLREKTKQDYGYFFQRWSDDVIDNTTLSAMMMDYGIDPITGKTYPLTRLKEIYSKYEGVDDNGNKFSEIEFKSLWDMIEMTGDKVKENDSPIIINQFTGEKISDKTYTNFRRKATGMIARVKGNMSADDIAGYKTHAIGRLIMQFRGWIPATVRERFKGQQYNLTMEQMEVGRLVAVKNLVGKNLKDKAFQFAKEMIPFLNGQFDKNNESMRTQYDLFIADNPNLAPDDSNPSLEQVTYEQYVNSHISEVRALAKELQMYFALAGMLGLLSLAAGDDELKENPLLRAPVALIDRAMLELGFFIPVFGMSEQAQLFTRAPAASISLFTSAASTVKNTFTESYDLFTGAKWDETTVPTLGDKSWTLDYSPRKDASILGYHTVQWIPPAKFITNVTGIMGTTERTDTWYDYLTTDWGIIK